MKMMDSISLVGITAGTIAILGYLPQIHKSHKMKEMKDLSIWLMVLFTASSLLWTVYGILKYDFVLFCLSSVTFSLSLILITMKLLYEKKLQLVRGLFDGVLHPNLGLVRRVAESSKLLHYKL